jgi:AcrR family transcriptional regulator
MAVVTTVGRPERHKQRTRRALEQAALHLFAERGFDATTVEDITDRADVSPRTFFRYFAAKDDVLFSSDDPLLARFHELILRRPAAEPPVVALGAAFAGWLVDEPLEEERLFLRERAIQSTPLLQGRRLEEQRRWEASIAEALTARGGDDPDDPTARLLAAVVLTVLRVALDRWLEDEGRSDLPALVASQYRLLPQEVARGRRRPRRAG